MEPQESFQAQQGGVCFGCGSKNEHGLQIKSFPVGGKMVCDWQPKPYHCAGSTFMNGGIIATILDCHLGAAAVHRMYEDAGLTHGEDEAELHCVTGNLNVDYLAPTPIDGPVRLEAHASGIEGRKIYVEGTLSAKGNITAKATGLFIKVDSSKSILD